MHTVGAGVREIRIRTGIEHRVLYVAKFAEAVYILHAYEKRIAELEAELAMKGQQNAELIKAKIETTRKKLEVERGHEPLNWN